MTPLGLDILYEFLSTNLNNILNDSINGEDIVTYIYKVLASKMTDDGEIKKVSIYIFIKESALQANNIIIAESNLLQLLI